MCSRTAVMWCEGRVDGVCGWVHGERGREQRFEKDWRRKTCKKILSHLEL